jgi:hypothetical protein
MKGSAEAPTFLDSEGNDMSKRIAVVRKAEMAPPLPEMAPAKEPSDVAPT